MDFIIVKNSCQRWTGRAFFGNSRVFLIFFRDGVDTFSAFLYYLNIFAGMVELVDTLA